MSLDATVQESLLKEQISERHARSLLRVTDKFKQVDLLNKKPKAELFHVL